MLDIFPTDLDILLKSIYQRTCIKAEQQDMKRERISYLDVLFHSDLFPILFKVSVMCFCGFGRPSVTKYGTISTIEHFLN